MAQQLQHWSSSDPIHRDWAMLRGEKHGRDTRRVWQENNVHGRPPVELERDAEEHRTIHEFLTQIVADNLHDLTYLYHVGFKRGFGVCADDSTYKPSSDEEEENL